MTPGQYLYLLRKAANLSRQDIALRIDTAPPVSARAREQLLVSLEADLVPMSVSDAEVLGTIAELRVNLPHLCDLIETPTVVPIRPRLVALGAEPRA